MSTQTNFPILYNESKGRKWSIWVIDDCIYRTDGLSRKEFVKKPSCRKVQAKGKNTPNEQALLEAKRAWIKKLDGEFFPAKDDDEGQAMYLEVTNLKNKQGGNLHGISKKTTRFDTEDKDEERDTTYEREGEFNVEDDQQVDTDNGGYGMLSDENDYMTNVKSFKVMLAEKYDEKKAKIVWDNDRKKEIAQDLLRLSKGNSTLAKDRFRDGYFDATCGMYIQPKLDGCRCVAYVGDNGKAICQTRQNKQYAQLTRQKQEIADFLGDTGIVLDGEWYVHKPVVNNTLLVGNDKHRFIGSCCKTSLKVPNACEDMIEYHVYDIIDDVLTQKERLKFLQKLFSQYDGKYIKPVRLGVVKSEEEIKAKMEKFLADDYEGAILRNPFSKYQNKRTLHLLKFKYFDDAEFKIVGAKACKGTKEGAVTWICETEGGKQFSCDMNCPVAESRRMYQHHKEYIGQMLKVKFFGKYDTGIPRFPKGLEIRDMNV